MKFEWNPEKNDWLKEHRGISFEEIVARFVLPLYRSLRAPTIRRTSAAGRPYEDIPKTLRADWKPKT